jgi:hypothetical protein
MGSLFVGLLSKILVTVSFTSNVVDFTIINWAITQRLVKREDHLSIQCDLLILL